MMHRDLFEQWVQRTSVWRKYRQTSKPCSLRQHPDGSYADYRINDRWQAWKAALVTAATLKQDTPA